MLPEPLPSPVVDNHTHLDHIRAGDAPTSLDEKLARAGEVNVTRMVQIGCELDSARWTVDTVDRYPQLLGGVALHPTEATAIAERGGRAALEDALREIGDLATHPRVRVIGETGLDHYWVKDAEGLAAQEVSFRAHIGLAKRLGKVLQIHDRDAHADVLRVLEDEGAPEHVVLHCFSGDPEMARYCTDRGWYLSFAGTLTFKNAEPLREALRAVPLENVLVETDAPYLAPVPYRGKENSGYLVPFTVRCMADVRSLPVRELCERLDATSEALYGPW